MTCFLKDDKIIEGSMMTIVNDNRGIEGPVKSGNIDQEKVKVIPDIDQYYTQKFIKLIYGEGIIEMIKSAITFKWVHWLCIDLHA